MVQTVVLVHQRISDLSPCRLLDSPMSSTGRFQRERYRNGPIPFHCLRRTQLQNRSIQARAQMASQVLLRIFRCLLYILPWMKSLERRTKGVGRKSCPTPAMALLCIGQQDRSSLGVLRMTFQVRQHIYGCGVRTDRGPMESIRIKSKALPHFEKDTSGSSILCCSFSLS
jgi:hypothetical protein